MTGDGTAPVKPSVIRRAHGDDGVVVLTIDNPPVNALPSRFYEECAGVFEELDADPDVRAVVLTGAGGRVFSAGQDLREIRDFTPDSSERRKEKIARAMTAVRRSVKPIVVALNGPVVGAGLMLASLGDVLIAADHATLKLTEIDVGVVGGARHALRVLPSPVVRYLVLTGLPLTAAEAHRLGAVAEVVAASELLERAGTLARIMAGKDARAIAAWKATLAEIESMSLEEGWAVERARSLVLEQQIYRFPNSSESQA